MVDGMIDAIVDPASAAANVTATANAMLDAARDVAIDAGLIDPDDEDDVTCYRLTCWSHLRCLFQNEAMIEEKLVLSTLMATFTFEQSDRLEKCASSLLYALQKNFSDGHGVYAKSSVKDFMMDLCSTNADAILMNIGRAGTGSRQDAQFENAWRAYNNIPLYNAWLVKVEKEQGSDTMSILDKSCFSRSSSLIFYAVFRARGIMWHVCYRYLRELTNGVEKGYSIHNMGLVVDQLHKVMSDLVQSPTLARDKDFRVFPVEQWPVLSDYDNYLKSLLAKSVDKKSKTNVEEIQGKALFDCDDVQLNEYTDMFIVAMAKGALVSLERNCSTWLTHLDGVLCYEKWTPAMIHDLKYCLKTNILLGESLFATVDYHYRRYINAYISTVDGVATALLNKSYSWPDDEDSSSERLSDLWSKVILEAALRMIKQNRKLFRQKEEDDKALNLANEAKRIEMITRKECIRVQKKQRIVVCYHGLQRIKTEIELRLILANIKSISAKQTLLINQLKIYGKGFSLADHDKPMSNVKDAYVGTIDDLTNRLIAAILTTTPAQLLQPPLCVMSRKSDVQLVGVQTPQVVEMRNSYHNMNVALVQTLHDLNIHYSVKLHVPWEKLVPYTWPVLLTETQKQFTSGVVFTLPRCDDEDVDDDDDDDDGDDKRYMCAGIQWVEKEQDYCLYYHKADESEPDNIDDDDVFTAFFRDDAAYISKMSILS
jgi:hypothetical protein